MDRQCDYLVYSHRRTLDDEEHSVECDICNNVTEQQKYKTVKVTGKHNTESYGLGVMINYVHDTLSEHKQTNAIELYTPTPRPDVGVIKTIGDFTMRDIPCCGTWFGTMSYVTEAFNRLRKAAGVCHHLPALQKLVLEQKNDDRLLHLVSKYVQQSDAISLIIDMFGVFACDVILAPILHAVLRSDWLRSEKLSDETHNALKLGWAQEFYNYKIVPTDTKHEMVFSAFKECDKDETKHNQRCVAVNNIMRKMIGFMARHGYTPWAAVNSVRTVESDLCATLICTDATAKHCVCADRLFASCAYLLECAAVEAAVCWDWLTRNEAVVQLCWVLCQIHGTMDTVVLDTKRLCSIHTVHMHAAYDYLQSQDNVCCAAILYANNHLSTTEHQQTENAGVEVVEKTTTTTIDHIKDELAPTTTPTRTIMGSVVAVSGLFYDNICRDVTVLDTARFANREALPDKPACIAAHILLHYPRVSESAIKQLSFVLPTRKSYLGIFWPEFVNATRACYSIYKAISLPPAPNPVYVMDLLVHAWRSIKNKTMRTFVPFATGPMHHIGSEHYQTHFAGPLNILQTRRVITERERTRVERTLREGVLPWFSGPGDSCSDKVISYTLAVAYAGCGVYLGRGPNNRDTNCSPNAVVVTHAGVIYFAVWYILVYICAVHTQPGLKKTVLDSNSEANKLVTELFDVNDGTVTYFDGQRLRSLLSLIFDGLLEENEHLHIATLCIPAMWSQLRYVTDTYPGDVYATLSVKRNYFIKVNNITNRATKQRLYLGAIAENVHSTKNGTLRNPFNRHVANAIDSVLDIEYDVWCNTLFEIDDSTEVLSFAETLTLDLNDATRGCSTEPNTDTCTTADVDDNIISSLGRKNDVVCLCPGLTVTGLSTTPVKVAINTENVDRFNYTVGCEDVNVSTLSLNNLKQIDVVSCPAEQSTVFKQQKLNASKTREYNRLIEALWYLLCGEHPTGEPETPARLAVMVHLVAKNIQTQDSIFAICADIKKLYGTCNKTDAFLPIVSIVCHMYKVNIPIKMGDFVYLCKNKTNDPHTTNAAGWLLWDDGNNSGPRWLVIHSAQYNSASTTNLAHTGIIDADTLSAYLSLNKLYKEDVPSDDYCGFHTINRLLNIYNPTNNKSTQSMSQLRNIIARTTCDYVRNRGKDEHSVKTYLDCLQRESSTNGKVNVFDTLMEDKRWLTVSDISIIFLAYDKKCDFILETTYPIYRKDTHYIILHNNHYTPVFAETT